MDRIEWIDRCKAIGIFFVILGHIMVDNKYIYGFHMPLFFFLSGIVFNERKYNFKSFLKSRVNSLLIPFVFFYLVTWLYWLFVERSFRPINLHWWQPLLGLIYASPEWRGLMAHNGILWFLPCLFVVELLAFGIFFITKNILYRWVAAIFCVMLGLSIDYPLPWCINMAMVCLQFFFIGSLAHTKLNSLSLSKSNIASLAIVSCFFYIICQYLSGNSVNIAYSEYGNWAIFEISAYLGIITITFLSMLFPSNKKNMYIKGGPIIQFIGRNTLLIFAIHQPILRILRFAIGKVCPSFPYDKSWWAAFLLAVIVIICIFPLIPVYNNFREKYLKRIYMHT